MFNPLMEDAKRLGYVSEIIRKIERAEADIRELKALVGLSGGGITGLDVSLDTTNFNRHLDATDTDAQKGFDTIDDHLHTAADVAPSHGNGATILAGATQYLTPYCQGLNAGLNASWVLGGTFKIIRQRIDSAQPASGSLVLTLQINNVDTALVLTIPAGSGIGSYANSVLTAAVLAGNLVRIKVVNNAAAASAQIAGFGVQCQYSV